MNIDPRNAYRQSAAVSADPIRLVILLYEQAIEDLRRAQAALKTGNIEQRTAEISHALSVIGQLQATLDLEHGGEVARNLDQFYEIVRARLLQAQIRQSREILGEQMSLLLSMQEAWREVERAERQVPEAAPEATASASAGEWRA